jgi:hypothetical protein
MQRTTILVLEKYMARITSWHVTPKRKNMDKKTVESGHDFDAGKLLVSKENAKISIAFIDASDEKLGLDMELPTSVANLLRGALRLIDSGAEEIELSLPK